MLVYIHDLDIKQEVQARRSLVGCGSDNAISIRFTPNVSEAAIWVLKPDSASMQYAQKKASAAGVELLTFENGQFQRVIHSRATLLSSAALRKLIESKSKHLQLVEPPQKHCSSNDTLASALLLGTKQKKGNLSITYQNALIFIDFAQQKASFNRAAQQLLTDNKPIQLSLLTFSKQARSPYEMPYSSSLFALVWQLCHLIDHSDLVSPLCKDTAIKITLWPNFEQVKHSFDDYRLASILQKRSLSATQCIQLLKLEEKQVFTFFNSLVLCNMAYCDTQQAIQINRAHKKSMLSDLWKKLRKSVKD